jgi:hypothetical protein
VGLAAERGCTVVTASALGGSVSAANLVACGFRPVQEVALYRVDPSS